MRNGGLLSHGGYIICWLVIGCQQACVIRMIHLLVCDWLYVIRMIDLLLACDWLSARRDRVPAGAPRNVSSDVGSHDQPPLLSLHYHTSCSGIAEC